MIPDWVKTIDSVVLAVAFLWTAYQIMLAPHFDGDMVMGGDGEPRIRGEVNIGYVTVGIVVVIVTSVVLFI